MESKTCGWLVFKKQQIVVSPPTPELALLDSVIGLSLSGQILVNILF